MKRRWSSLVFGVMALASAAIGESPAFANGRIPAASQIVVDPNNQDHMLTRATFGALVSNDRGNTWHWVCEQSIGYSGIEDPAYGITASGTLVSAIFEGLSVSTNGCNWALAKGEPVVSTDDAGLSTLGDAGVLEKQVFVDLVLRPGNEKELFALSSGFASKAEDAGTFFFSTKVFRSLDSAVSWKQIGADIDPSILGETIEVAKSDPLRLYISGERGVGVNPVGVVLRSIDGGEHFIESSVPFTVDGELALYIAGVSPTDPNRVYARTSGPRGGPTRLLVSNDGGGTFSVALTGKGPLLGFALSPDGATVYVGGPQDGLLRAPSSTLSFAQVSTVPIQCLTRTQDALWACSQASTFVAGVSTDDGATFTTKLMLDQVQGPLDCPVGSTTEKECVSRWPQQKSILGIPEFVDGGDLVVNDEAGVATPPVIDQPKTKDGCSCSLEDRSAATLPLLGGIAAFVAAYAARRRRRT